METFFSYPGEGCDPYNSAHTSRKWVAALCSRLVARVLNAKRATWPYAYAKQSAPPAKVTPRGKA